MIQFNIADHARQKFSARLNNRRVTIELWYSVYADRWSMNLSIDGEPVLHGRKVVTGVDLLAAFNFGVGVIFADSELGKLPGRDELPQGTVKLYHTTREEIDAAVAS